MTETTGVEPAGTEADTAQPEATTPLTTLPVDTGEAFGADWGLPDLGQHTSVVGAGQRPLFEWDPIDLASGYMLYVYDPDGALYWSWMGPDTSTYLGGAIRLDDDKPGPRALAGMSWVVAAIDDELEILAMSERRWVAP